MSNTESRYQELRRRALISGERKPLPEGVLENRYGDDEEWEKMTEEARSIER